MNPGDRLIINTDLVHGLKGRVVEYIRDAEGDEFWDYLVQLEGYQTRLTVHRTEVDIIDGR